MLRGTRVGQAYVAVTADGDGINKDIVDGVDKAGPGVEKAGEEHGERYGDKFNDGFWKRIKGKFHKGLSKEMGDAGDEGGRNFTDRFESHFDNDFLDRLGARAGGHLVDALNFAMSREGGDNPLADLFDRWTEDAVSGNRGGKAGGKRGLGDIVGRMLGGGSRNNALNLFGKTIGGVLNLMQKGGQVATTFFSAFSKGFSEVAEGASLLEKIGGGFAKAGAEGGGALSKLAAGGPAAAASLLAVVVVLAEMVAVVGALIGLVTALAATIANALTGAVLVLGGAFAAVAAAAGLLVIAFTSMTDAQMKMLTNAFRPLKAELAGLGQIMLTQMVPAFSIWSKNLQDALYLALPVAQVMGQAFAQAGSIITAAFSGPGFQLFAQMLAVYLPGIVVNLSRALGSFMNGMAGLFAALLPYVSQFAGYLARVAQNFSTWATSAQGQNSISSFVDRALQSLRSLWNAVSAIGGFIIQVLFNPQSTSVGDSIFDSIAKTFQSMTRAVKRAQADGSFKKWLTDAKKFGEALWNVMKALYKVFMAFYNSGLVKGLSLEFKYLGWVLGTLSKPIKWLVDGLGWVGTAVDKLMGKLDSSRQATGAWFTDIVNTVSSAVSTASSILSQNSGIGSAGGIAGYNTPGPSSVSLQQLQSSGMDALNATSTTHGGYKPPKQKKQWKNPYVAFANSLIKQGPSTRAQLKSAMIALNTAAAKGIRDAAATTGGFDASRTGVTDVMTNIRQAATQAVQTARDALNTAASNLASASSKGQAAKALKQVHKAQADLRNALGKQYTLNDLAKKLAKQNVVKSTNVYSLVAGLKTTNVTLAEFAEARSRVAAKLADANQKLTDAIALRDQYKTSVTDSIKTFGDLATAQAQTIDGVEQALTAGDITSNLQSRLDKIKHFQSDLQLLLAQGLSDKAYKQIVDQGVENGTTLADALLAGGSSAIQNTNSLVDQIDTIAGKLGTETSNRLYQAGVDAAQGLVDGLTSLSAQLDSAAAKLGNSIAAAIKKSLGIRSPSTVLRDMMDYVGDGAVVGLDNQHVKVGSAAAALASVISVNPTATPRTSTTTDEAVSGNSNQRFRDLIVQTPTEDPEAVAHEVLNEVVGRL